MTTPDSHSSPSSPAPDDVLRPHTYDGIQEYDKRLPRWWLLTLYGAMVFSVGYWGYYHTYSVGEMPTVALEKEMTANTARAAARAGIIDDEVLWKMSRQADLVAAGKVTFETTCAACHKADLTGLIGPNLLDTQWIHGGLPLEVARSISEGVAVKGMPAWGTILGPQKTNELVAYIFSFHQPGEAVVTVPGWTPPGAPAPTP